MSWTWIFSLVEVQASSRVNRFTRDNEPGSCFSATGLVRQEQSALLAHDAAFDEHHDRPAFYFVVAQAISSGCGKGLTLVEGLPVFCFHVGHHVAHASLLGESSAGDADRSNSRHGYDQSTHDVSPLAKAIADFGRESGGLKAGTMMAFAMVFRFFMRNL
jgi:hypothetical protein